MRKLRRFALASVLALAFANTGFAGIVPIVPEPQPQPASALEAQIETPDMAPADGSVQTTDPIIVFALNLLQGVLTVL